MSIYPQARLGDEANKTSKMQPNRLTILLKHALLYQVRVVLLVVDGDDQIIHFVIHTQLCVLREQASHELKLPNPISLTLLHDAKLEDIALHHQKQFGNSSMYF